MEYTTVSASKPGSAAPKIEKRTGDEKIFMVDCSTILNDKEMIRTVTVINQPEQLSIEDIRISEAKFIRFKLKGGPTSTPYADYLVNYSVSTTSKNVIVVPVSVRVYSI